MGGSKKGHGREFPEGKGGHAGVDKRSNALAFVERCSAILRASGGRLKVKVLLGKYKDEFGGNHVPFELAGYKTSKEFFADFFLHTDDGWVALPEFEVDEVRARLKHSGDFPANPEDGGPDKVKGTGIG